MPMHHDHLVAGAHGASVLSSCRNMDVKRSLRMMCGVGSGHEPGQGGFVQENLGWW